MAQDARGLAITATDDAAVAHFDAAIAAYCGARRDTGDHLKRAQAADGGMVLGHVLRGYFMQLFATRTAVARAAQAAAAARVAAEAGATARERRHLDALTRWIAGDLAEPARRGRRSSSAGRTTSSRSSSRSMRCSISATARRCAR